jgi:hypothetical protein
LNSKEPIDPIFLAKPSSEIIKGYVEKILKLLCEAYYDLVSRSDVQKDSFEDEITDFLFDSIQIKCETEPSLPFIPGPQRPIKSKIHKNVSFKKIDLGFKYRSTRKLFFGVECKIIDREKKSAFKLYFEEGLDRFLNCDYSHDSYYSAMAGYVRNGDPKTIAIDLIQYAIFKRSDLPEIKESSKINSFDDIYESTHVRKITGCASPIKIFHLILAFYCT